MADLNSRNGPSNKSSCEEEGAIEKDLVLQPVSPSCETSIASSSRPKRQKRKWPPRSPSPQPKGNQKGAHGDGSSGKISIKEEFCVTIEEDEDDDSIKCTDVEAADDEAGSQGSPGQGASGAKQTGKNVRVRSKGQVWTHVCSLPSEEMFQKWRKESDKKISPGKWSKKRVNETKTGLKRYYHCSIPGCKAELTILYPNESETVEVSHNEKPHFHPPRQRKWGLSEDTKQEIKRLWESGVQKPRLIKAALEKVGLDDCTKAQLSNFLDRLKKNANPPKPPLSVNALQEWCAEHSITQLAAALDGDLDRVFVFEHDINANARQVRLSLSSKRLMKLAAQATTINLDASQRMKWFDTSVLFIGVSDAGGAFFPVMFSIISQETTCNYLNLLNVLKRSVKSLSGSEFRPRCIIGNGDPNLTEAVDLAFPDAVIRMCWLQVKKEVNALLKPIDKEVRDSLETDISTLRLSCDQKQFELAAKLMLEKWRRLLPSSDIPDKFEERFVRQHPEWHEGFDVESHSSNGSLMRTVNAVKNRHTLRERLPVERYLALALELVLEWSLSVTDTEDGALQSTVTPDKVLWHDTCRLQNEHKTMVDINSAIYVPTGSNTDVTVEEVNAFEQKMSGNVKSFDEFVEARMSLWKVIDTGNKSDISHMRCTCPKFFSAKLCEHVLAIGAALGLVTIPSSAWESAEGFSELKRKRGRPRKKKSADEQMTEACSEIAGCVQEEEFIIE